MRTIKREPNESCSGATAAILLDHLSKIENPGICNPTTETETANYFDVCPSERSVENEQPTNFHGIPPSLLSTSINQSQHNQNQHSQNRLNQNQHEDPSEEAEYLNNHCVSYQEEIEFQKSVANQSNGNQSRRDQFPLMDQLQLQQQMQHQFSELNEFGESQHRLGVRDDGVSTSMPKSVGNYLENNPRPVKLEMPHSTFNESGKEGVDLSGIPFFTSSRNPAFNQMQDLTQPYSSLSQNSYESNRYNLSSGGVPPMGDLNSPRVRQVSSAGMEKRDLQRGDGAKEKDRGLGDGDRDGDRDVAHRSHSMNNLNEQAIHNGQNGQHGQNNRNRNGKNESSESAGGSNVIGIPANIQFPTDQKMPTQNEWLLAESFDDRQWGGQSSHWQNASFGDTLNCGIPCKDELSEVLNSGGFNDVSLNQALCLKPEFSSWSVIEAARSPGSGSSGGSQISSNLRQDRNGSFLDQNGNLGPDFFRQKVESRNNSSCDFNLNHNGNRRDVSVRKEAGCSKRRAQRSHANNGVANSNGNSNGKSSNGNPEANGNINSNNNKSNNNSLNASLLLNTNNNSQSYVRRSSSGIMEVDEDRSSMSKSPRSSFGSSSPRGTNKSFSSSLCKFTLPDENGKRKIRSEIMSIAESLPALPGLYFDKKQKGFRVRYQNVYVGWVALSRFASIEEAYCSARDIWENAKAHADKFQTPHAAVMASLPLQKEAQASGKNRGGRPRTVTQLPINPSEWAANSFTWNTSTQPIEYTQFQNCEIMSNWNSLLTPASTKATFADCAFDGETAAPSSASGFLSLEAIAQCESREPPSCLPLMSDILGEGTSLMEAALMETAEHQVLESSAISYSKPVVEGPPPSDELSRVLLHMADDDDENSEVEDRDPWPQLDQFNIGAH